MEPNALRSHIADIDGAPVHYLRFDGEHAGTLPIVLTHVWPNSFAELVTLARAAGHAVAARRCGRRRLHRHRPSLPGYPFSSQRPSLPPDLRTHEIWHRLIELAALAESRYGAAGTDRDFVFVQTGTYVEAGLFGAARLQTGDIVGGPGHPAT